MYLKLLITAVAGLTILNPALGESSREPLLMVGYQGWHLTPNDGVGAKSGWYHWNVKSGVPSPQNVHFDLWPDMREFAPEELHATELFYPDGKNAGVYSAYDERTIDRHFRWMAEYNIDGVYLQRQILSLGTQRGWRDEILRRIRKSAEKYHRKFAVMFADNVKSGSAKAEKIIGDDWVHIVKDLKVTESPAYLRADGKPVAAIWGFGVNTRPDTPEEALNTIRSLRNENDPSLNAFVVMGGLRNWRSSPEWASVYLSADCISPWTVGTGLNEAGADKYKTQFLVPDLKALSKTRVELMPVIYPGVSALHEGREFNRAPRCGGRFYWRQGYNAASAGAKWIYVAMFDEIDEGTAIFKLAATKKDIPVKVQLVTLDQEGEAVPSDWYLRLSGEIKRMLTGELKPTSAMPIDPRSNPGKYPLTLP